ncbi:RodZ domain-containing protein [Maridesulfovibrio sp.]|uniref:helix-turn-helix domain-containing protein n=1 Tax=Maridesulfovibrio sp. TaxID=2795000 RepID=UPI002A18CA06|nr:RodZ domain-containing protein [Maridesulfovibrio sp.]
MDLKELGSRLREERQRQRLSVEQIMEITKISRINIDALENGDQKEFPHAVYAKGFIKNYARALGLDPEEIGEEFSRLLGTSFEDDVFSVEAVPQPVIGESGRKSLAGPILLIVLLVAVVGGLVYYLHDSSMFDFGGSEHSEKAVQEKPAEQAPAPVPEQPVVEEAPAEQAVPGEVKAEEGEPVANTAEPAAAEQTAVEEQAAPAPAAVPAALGNVVEIRARAGEVCWVEAVADGKRSEMVLQEGESVSFPYSESLKIKLGNAGGVDITSDGKPFGIEASKGAVKTLDFPAAP